jgi:hypothetical protein
MRARVAGNPTGFSASTLPGPPHTGLLFVPALVVLAVGTVKLWREQL